MLHAKAIFLQDVFVATVTTAFLLDLEVAVVTVVPLPEAALADHRPLVKQAIEAPEAWVGTDVLIYRLLRILLQISIAVFLVWKGRMAFRSR